MRKREITTLQNTSRKYCARKGHALWRLLGYVPNPVALPIGPLKIAEKRAEALAAGIILPEDLDDETFVTLFGLGSTFPRPGKEMEAIRAANFLTNNDPSGAEWIRFNRAPVKDCEGRARTGRRRK